MSGHTDPERFHDAQRPVHIVGRRPLDGPADEAHRSARRDLAAELEQKLPCRSERETMLAALRAVWALADWWAQGVNDVGPAAAAEVRDAIRGDL